MDSTSGSKPSPFPPTNEVPLGRNPPLAPSQEMAYRNKCIQLKRRLTEIETTNDATRKRISSERERIQKMRLMRAILLDKLQSLLSGPGQSLTPEQLQKLGIDEVVEEEEQQQDELLKGEDNNTLLDDSSDESEEEDIPEPSERPTRIRRTNNSYRETVMNASTVPPPQQPSTTTTAAAAASYQSTGLPNLAPATTSSSYSPTQHRDTAGQQSFSHVGSTPMTHGSPGYSPQSAPQAHESRTTYAQSSPLQQHQSIYQEPVNGATATGTGSPHLVPPVRPEPPQHQFYTHMRPQLEADDYPPEQINSRIEDEWRNLSAENRQLWQDRYSEQMVDYEAEMDAYRAAKRRHDYR